MGSALADAQSAAMSDLKQEIATYHRRLPELLGHQGKVVLIKGDEVAGIFDSYRDALTAGRQRFEPDSFLVRRIAAPESLDGCRGSNKQRSLLDHEGSGRELWDRNSSETLRKLRDEWNR